MYSPSGVLEQRVFAHRNLPLFTPCKFIQNPRCLLFINSSGTYGLLISCARLVYVVVTKRVQRFFWGSFQ